MASTTLTAMEVHGALPEGVEHVKDYRDGTTLALCRDHRLGMVRGLFGSGYSCEFCKQGTNVVHPDPSTWPPVKVLVRIIRPRGVDRHQDVLC